MINFQANNNLKRSKNWISVFYRAYTTNNGKILHYFN